MLRKLGVIASLRMSRHTCGLSATGLAIQPGTGGRGIAGSRAGSLHRGASGPWLDRLERAGEARVCIVFSR